jgi:hypothetical protein
MALCLTFGMNDISVVGEQLKRHQTKKIQIGIGASVEKLNFICLHSYNDLLFSYCIVYKSNSCTLSWKKLNINVMTVLDTLLLQITNLNFLPN